MKLLQAGVAFAAASMLCLSGCGYVAPVMPPQGLIYADIQAPLDPDTSGTPIAGLREGTAESTSILGLVAMGDASLNTAALNGGIGTIEHVDYHYTNILFIYQKFVIKAYGE